jgi:peptidoglycan/xylan/chitin deacetylase (PgdA/CDA1 family)
VTFLARAIAIVLTIAGMYAAELVHREVAITIDDLPLGGDDTTPCTLDTVRRITAKLLRPFAEQKIPVIGFVNAGRCEDFTPQALREILNMWLDAGADLGNHTYSHPDLNDTPLAEYEADILRGEPAIREALAQRGKTLRYFRHPFLRTGPDLATKHALENFLAAHGYTIAPVTLDNSDYMFATVYADALQRHDLELAGKVKSAYIPYMDSIFAFFEVRSREVVGHEIAQTLLIHAHQLNAESMPALLQMMRSRGYEFVTLDRALADDGYRLPNEYAGPGGFSWIHRWSMTKHMQPKGEPDEPRYITDAYQKLRSR